MMNPAHTVIQICGGFKIVAEITGRDETRVRRWAYPKSRGGTDGLIPSDCQQKLMEAAYNGRFNLKPEHFFNPAAGSRPQSNAAPKPRAKQPRKSIIPPKVRA